MIKINLFPVILILLITVLEMNVISANLPELLPAYIDGWVVDGEDRLYTTETLYDYIDGGAELYLSYGMDSVISRRYSKAGAGEIRVEIFDMIESKNAFGVFTHTRTLDEKKLGQGSQYFIGAQIFWKGRYFITIIADDENDEIIDAIAEISSAIEQKIKSVGELPEILQYLPAEDLRDGRYIFFHHYIWQNSYFFLSNENIFGIDDNTSALLVKFGESNKPEVLLLIEYIDSEAASSAALQFRKTYLSNSSDNISSEIEKDLWVACKQTGNMLACVFNAKSQLDVNEILNKTGKEQYYSPQIKN